MQQRMLINFHLQTFLYKVAEAFMLLLFLAWVLANKSGTHVICFLSYINNRQQAATHNVVVDKLDGIKRSLCEIRDNLKWFKPNNKHHSPKPTKLYEGSILKLWNEFKRILDAKRKLDNALKARSKT